MEPNDLMLNQMKRSTNQFQEANSNLYIHQIPSEPVLKDLMHSLPQPLQLLIDEKQSSSSNTIKNQNSCMDQKNLPMQGNNEDAIFDKDTQPMQLNNGFFGNLSLPPQFI
mmetsp:Transcript_5930/g.5354  ORF Transcript_5930/g.5354 Transcript_5930/m.5354 type:complete len:110 (+) Transcript_5930:142-471(+)